ncbi:hypothetical protein [Pseudoalteromonas sp. T1lg10]|uniref:hypothetical protein n=1 Tax=Pseudoalteromonas sp. T1lg10 TaxID=2077093 RepID=UPI000CF62776|nr:hypothetical protein [Pseudoalteromonas sp. T1lg10]
MWPYIILALILVKTSLLGLGGLSIVLALLGLLLLRLGLGKPEPWLRRRAAKILKLALGLHLLAYAMLLIKLFTLESWEDVPILIASHLVLHHMMAAFIGATLIFMLIRSYFIYKDQVGSGPAENA